MSLDLEYEMILKKTKRWVTGKFNIQSLQDVELLSYSKMSRTILKTHSQLLERRPCAKNSIVSEICGVVQGPSSRTIAQISP